MNQWKRLAYYLLINVLVSACTTVAVLYLWDRTHAPAGVGLQPVAFNASGASGQPASTTLPAVDPVETSALTATPTLDPYDNAIAYEVKANDTLGDIANRFDVPLDELLEYNGLNDANALSIGQVIYIPQTLVAPVETATPQETAASAAAQVTGSPATPRQPARVVINSVIGPGDLASERVFLTRAGDGQLSLAGWKLEDQDGNVFSFPQIELYNDGAVNIWTTVGTQTVVDLYWGLSAPIWESGETVTLQDGQGKTQATYKVP